MLGLSRSPLLCIGDGCVIGISAVDFAWIGATFIGLGAAHLILWGIACLICPRFSPDHSSRERQLCSATFNITCLLILSVMSVLGFVAWISLDSYFDSDVVFRMFLRSYPAMVLLRLMIGYQFYNIVASVALKEGCEPVFIAHHAAVLVLCVLALHPFAHFYVPFFLGVVESSSVFLCVVTIFKAHKILQSKLPAINTFFRAAFALFFMACRVVVWLPLSVLFWVDCVWLIRHHQVHSVPVVGIFFAGNVLLTGMQLYWAVLIARPLRKMLFANRKDSTEAQYTVVSVVGDVENAGTEQSDSDIDSGDSMLDTSDFV